MDHLAVIRVMLCFLISLLARSRSQSKPQSLKEAVSPLLFAYRVIELAHRISVIIWAT
jgi:hypothetical protein